MPDVIEKRVAIARNTPGKTREFSVEPLLGTTSALEKVPARRKMIPGRANLRAAVLEKYEKKRNAGMGLMLHHGSEPGPPGFARSAKFGPPPGTVRPISKKSLVGCRSNPKEFGAASKKGIRKSAARLDARWIKSGSFALF
jgi:hypothetical protein